MALCGTALIAAPTASARTPMIRVRRMDWLLLDMTEWLTSSLV
jgi:hypothetical protein